MHYLPCNWASSNRQSISLKPIPFWMIWTKSSSINKPVRWKSPTTDALSQSANQLFNSQNRRNKKTSSLPEVFCDAKNSSLVTRANSPRQSSAQHVRHVQSGRPLIPAFAWLRLHQCNGTAPENSAPSYSWP